MGIRLGGRGGLTVLSPKMYHKPPPEMYHKTPQNVPKKTPKMYQETPHTTPP